MQPEQIRPALQAVCPGTKRSDDAVGRVGGGTATELIKVDERRKKMMNGGSMMGGGGMVMMIGMGLVWLLTVVVLALATAALIKYLRSGDR